MLSWMSCRRRRRSQHDERYGRLVCDLSPRDHVTSALNSLRWLPVKQIIEFKLWLLVYLAVNGLALVHLHQCPHRNDDVSARLSFEPLRQQQ